MNSRLKIAIGAGIAIIVLLYAGLLLQSDSKKVEPESRTELTTSTTETTDSKANETKEKTNTAGEQGSDAESAASSSSSNSAKGAAVKTLETELFKKTKGKRIIFFYDKNVPTNKKTYDFVKANLNNFSKDATFFVADYDKNKELREHYGVTRPGVMIAFTADGDITGLYGAEEPSLEAIKSSLGI